MPAASLYRRWIWANAWSELVGLGGTFVLGYLLFSRPEDANPAVVVGGAAFAVVAGAALEGGLVGYAQARVLRTGIPRISAIHWIWATVLGAGTAWLLGMIPSTVMSLRGPPPGSTPPVEPSTAATLVLAAVMGLVLGPVLAGAQAVVLRRHVRRVWRWIAANALAWAAGMVVVFLGAGTLTEGASPWRIGLTVGLACLAAGATVGAIHGWFLLRLLRDPVESASHPPPP